MVLCSQARKDTPPSFKLDGLNNCLCWNYIFNWSISFYILNLYFKSIALIVVLSYICFCIKNHWKHAETVQNIEVCIRLYLLHDLLSIFQVYAAIKFTQNTLDSLICGSSKFNLFIQSICLNEESFDKNCNLKYVSNKWKKKHLC